MQAVADKIVKFDIGWGLAPDSAGGTHVTDLEPVLN